MNKKLRAGKSSELIVAGELTRHGLDVYLPVVDDQAIDLIIRESVDNDVRYFDVQVKSVEGYNRIVGVKNVKEKSGRYILIIHYRHENKEDEFFYLTKNQIACHHLEESEWGDLVFNKSEREKYTNQNLTNLAQKIKNKNL